MRPDFKLDLELLSLGTPSVSRKALERESRLSDRSGGSQFIRSARSRPMS